MQQDIHKQADAEPAEHHPHRGELRPVEEQGEEEGACHLCEEEGGEVHPLRVDEIAQNVGDHGAEGGHHRAEHHGAHGVGEKGGVDLQPRRKGNGHQLQGQPDGDHQCRKDQHTGVPQLCGGVPPVGGGKGVGVEGGGFLTVHGKRSFHGQLPQETGKG